MRSVVSANIKKNIDRPPNFKPMEKQTNIKIVHRISKENKRQRIFINGCRRIDADIDSNSKRSFDN